MAPKELYDNINGTVGWHKQNCILAPKYLYYGIKICMLKPKDLHDGTNRHIESQFSLLVILNEHPSFLVTNKLSKFSQVIHRWNYFPKQNLYESPFTLNLKYGSLVCGTNIKYNTILQKNVKDYHK